MVTYLSALLSSSSASSGVWKAQVKALHTSEVWYAEAHWASLLEDLGRWGQCCSICHINILLIEEVRKKQRGKKAGEGGAVKWGGDSRRGFAGGGAWCGPPGSLREALTQTQGCRGAASSKSHWRGECESITFQTMSLSPPSGQCCCCLSSSHRGTLIVTHFSF